MCSCHLPDSRGVGSEGRLDPRHDEGRSQRMPSTEDDNCERPEVFELDCHAERDLRPRVTLLSCLRCFACVFHPVYEQRVSRERASEILD